MYNTWERRDKKRTKGKTYKFKKNGEAKKNKAAHHRFSDEKLFDSFDEQEEPDDEYSTDAFDVETRA